MKPTPAIKILLKEADKQIQALKRELFLANAEIKTLKMELDQRKFCKHCLTLLIEESVFEGICQQCCEKGEWKEYANQR